MTEKLYYEDSHMKNFSAVVLSCAAIEDAYEAVLDRTAFFPEGGGQYADTGVIDGIPVTDVQERDGLIYHKMTAPLTVGKCVEGEIDWMERFSKMQQHSGEHIVSGIMFAKYGFHNVGFHMGKDAITMDFDGVISKSQLQEVERMANEAVVQNLEIQAFFPSPEELARMEYRSKIQIEGPVRIVTIPGHDWCACCAPHVKKTGEIGIIKFLGMQNYKGGIRVSMLCGFRALSDYEEKTEHCKELSGLLSAPESEVTDEVKRLLDVIAEQKGQILNLEHRLLACRANEIAEGQKLVVLFEGELEGNAPRALVNLLIARKTEIAAVFAGDETDGYRYVIGSRAQDVRPIAKSINEKFRGRGGGKPEMVQGSLGSAREDEIREEIRACVEKM